MSEFEFLDESVDDLYSDPDMVASMEQMEEDAFESPQEYGVYEATLFDY